MDGVKVFPLKRIDAVGGDVLHGIKASDIGFNGFGEAYFSIVRHGEVKAWKMHTKMTMNLIVPVGNVDFIFHDAQSFKIVSAGTDHYVRISVGPKIWFGFKGVGMGENLVLNIANIEHDSLESMRLPIDSIQFNWDGR